MSSQRGDVELGRSAPSAPPRPPVERRGTSPARAADAPWAWLMIAPLFAGLTIFFLWPIVQTVYFSFTESGPFGGSTWIGLDNYRALLGDEEVFQSIWNTLKFTFFSLAGVPLAVVFAAMLNQKGVKGVGFYRALFFIPVVTLPAAVAMVWSYLLNGDFGVVNYTLSLVGIDGPSWLADPDYALYSLVVVGVWSSIGYNIIILLAGLQTIPRDLYEASALDGAGKVRQFFSVTVPMLSPSIFFVTVLSVIGSLQMFDLVYVMVGRTSPALSSTKTIIYVFYEKGFIQNDRGYAATIVLVLLLLVLGMTLLQFRLQKRWVHYD
ncbi:MAG: sugar ABC transporter permease [Actinomycetia bacterium]|nr:sugar ABC transporter permease [Actinomycetes bacterium]